LAQQYFENISIDLIYGIPGQTKERWNKNLEIAISQNISHLSCYALTVEPKTALESFIEKGVVSPVDDAMAKEHYELLLSEMEKAGYENYEFSNFGKEGYHSQNNTAYWQGKSYVGIGPSAHSYDGKTRSWNVRNNTKYIQSIQAGILPSEHETLSTTDTYNEYIMTGLRTKWGVSLEKVAADYGKEFEFYLRKQAEELIKKDLLVLKENMLFVTKKGKFLSDGIAADLFLVNLDA
jgi:oxygen-independent coproporphyrinogen-3 oxidase